jgi:hypothetical protein
MKQEKSKKKKRLFKTILGIGAGIATLYVADKYIPGFNEKITKPVKGFAKSLASDVKEAIVGKEKIEKKEYTIKREDVDVVPRRDFDNNHRHHHHHKNERRNRHDRRY